MALIHHRTTYQFLPFFHFYNVKLSSEKERLERCIKSVKKLMNEKNRNYIRTQIYLDNAKIKKNNLRDVSKINFKKLQINFLVIYKI